MKKLCKLLLVIALLLCLPLAAQALELGSVTLYNENGSFVETYSSWYSAMQAANEQTNDLTKPVKLECEAGKAIPVADTSKGEGGETTHVEVRRSITVEGNGATMVHSSAKMDAEATFAVENSSQLLAETKITINNLKNATVWGYRTSIHTLTVELNDCDTNTACPTGNRVYITGSTGTNNITLNNCDFVGVHTAVYSNATGNITVNNCTFTDTKLGVNINTKTDNDNVIIRVTNSTFTNCGNGSNAEEKAYTAPIRVVNAGDAGSYLIVDGAVFNGTTPQNGHILLGDGRTGKDSRAVHAKITNTNADVQLQQPGYYDDSYKQDPEDLNLETISVNSKQSITVNCTRNNQDIVTITFETNGGSKIAPVKVPCESELADVLVNPPVPTRDGFDFGGWYRDADFNDEVTMRDTTLSADSTFYAKWIEKGAPSAPTAVPTAAPAASSVPKTGDNTPLALLLALLSLSAVSVAVLSRKRFFR